MGWGPCFTASECFKRIAEKNVIPEQLVKELIKRMKVRNIIIHRYLGVDYEELYKDTHKLISLTQEFEEHIVKFLRNLK